MSLTTHLLAASATLAAGVSALRNLALSRRLTEAERSAATDQLTGLANRVGLRREFEQLVVSARTDERIALTLIDLSGFKQINDTFGHAVGDQVLRHVARQLRRVRIDGKPAVVARLGGDEFVVVFRLDTDYYVVAELVDELYGAFDAPINVGEASVRARGTVGFAESPGRSAGLDELLAAADAAMYRAKRKGGFLGIYCEEDDGPSVRAPRPPIRTRDHRVPPPGAEVRSR